MEVVAAAARSQQLVVAVAVVVVRPGCRAAVVADTETGAEWSDTSDAPGLLGERTEAHSDGDKSFRSRSHRMVSCLSGPNRTRVDVGAGGKVVGVSFHHHQQPVEGLHPSDHYPAARKVRQVWVVHRPLRQVPSSA